VADPTAPNPFDELMTLAEQTCKELLFVRYPRGRWYSQREYADVEARLQSLAEDCSTSAQTMQCPERMATVDALIKEIDHFYHSSEETIGPVFLMPRVRVAISAIEPLRDDWLAWLCQQNAPSTAPKEQQAEGPQPVPTEPAAEATILPLKRPSRIAVDLDAMTIALDGQVTAIRNKMALRWLKVLIEHPNKWISGPELKKYDVTFPSSIRLDRLKEYLPPQIRSLIDSATGKGSRISSRKIEELPSDALA
jgi:hypothetical protein